MHTIGWILLSYFVLVLKHAYHGRDYIKDIFDAYAGRENTWVSPIVIHLVLGFTMVMVAVACPFVIIVEGLLDGDLFAVFRNPWSFAEPSVKPRE